VGSIPTTRFFSDRPGWQENMKERIGFIGVGIMGRGMVANLQTKGHDVTIFSREVARAKELARTLHVTSASSVPALAAASDVLMLCVPDTPDVENALFGALDAAGSLRSGSLVIDCSTISPTASAGFATRLRERGVGFVDAPVSGGSEGAAKGTLAIMAGGSAEDFARATPILEAIGTRITHMGAPGAGQSTKLLNQILVVVNMLAVGEALLFGKAAGIDLRKAVSAVENGAAGSWMLSNRAPQVLDDYWLPGFTIDLQQKDLRLVLEAAETNGVPLPATGLIRQLYAKLQHEGKGHLGNHALVQALEGLASLKINA
jgi:3-hydroxyisobutyrate dehydrogenase-like beta-hydroxyacid dehydrogenase